MGYLLVAVIIYAIVNTLKSGSIYSSYMKERREYNDKFMKEKAERERQIAKEKDYYFSETGCGKYGGMINTRYGDGSYRFDPLTGKDLKRGEKFPDPKKKWFPY
jgi:hypothetical protein